MDEIDLNTAAQHFLEILQKARAAGKEWWVVVQIKQIEESLWQAKKIGALTDALEMVRDADNDCKADGGNPLPIPPIARATVDAALAMAALNNDPKAVSFAEGF